MNQMSNHNKKLVEGLYKTSWRGLYFILKERRTFRKLPFILSLMLSILISLTSAILFPEKTYNILIQTADLAFSFFPGLLGFSLGGYAVAVGFTNTELIKLSAKRDEPSIYQLLNVVFASAIIIQVFTTLIAFIVTWTIRVNISDYIPVSSTILATTINTIILFLLLLGIIYSLIISIYVVLNLWSISQLNNSYYSAQKFKEENAKDKNEQEDKD
jgi:hypothetical protein